MTPKFPTAHRVAARHLEATDQPKQLLVARLRQIADRAGRLAQRARAQPSMPAHELAPGIQQIVELARVG